MLHYIGLVIHQSYVTDNECILISRGSTLNINKMIFRFRLCLEIIPMTDEIIPNDFDVLYEFIEFIRKSKDRSSPDDYSSRSSLNSIFAAGPEGDSAASPIKILPTIDEFERVLSLFSFSLPFSFPLLFLSNYKKCV